MLGMEPPLHRERPVERVLSDLEAAVFGGEGRSTQDLWQSLISAKVSRKLLGRCLSVAGATLFTCVPVSESMLAAAKLGDRSAIRGSGDRRGYAVLPSLRSSSLIESRQSAANTAVAAAAPWASAASCLAAKHCVEAWLAASEGAVQGGATASLHDLLPQALGAVKAQLPVLSPSTDARTDVPATRSIAIVRTLHWLMQQCDYLVLKDRAADRPG